ncbi:uncharacterized protein SPSK_03714 [Sporothrix schenckii 1099-18]|uniref:Uncharacterized protein n=1 Tax=Sporothrix schenckii 1099-18 TaxID=1397361 RepID=A0A0F2LZ46_SPOSC|nr:uncharacterized protein SPSK_03714 [Sporothrix schenckii 1099-18]KJR82733.1 hypothetical protein SPSK_03714 [Sporothrix schenckii 1099-18]
MPFTRNLLLSIQDDETVMPSSPSSPSLMACDPFAVMPMQDDGFPLPSSPASPNVPHPRFIIPSGGSEGIRSVPLPGVRCPKCAKDGKEVWVIPGRACGYCGTACG